MDLQDKIVIVTGASSGLGRVFAERLVGRGAQVYGLARSTDALGDIQSELGEAFHPVTCDVRRAEAVRRAARHVAGDAGRIDVLVNNAGLARFGAVDALTDEEWDVQMETNLRGVFLMTRAAVPHMKRQNEAAGFGGHVVNIASIAGLVSNPEMSAYNASKAGVRGFSKAIMKELRSDGIKVTCVYPGSIATSFGDDAGGGSGSANPMRPEDVASTVLHVLETPENYLISEIVMRPLRPKG